MKIRNEVKGNAEHLKLNGMGALMASLPLIEEFTIIDVGDQPNRQVVAGQEYAIVVTFVGRTSGTANQPIAFVLGRGRDEFPDGTASSDPDGMGFVNNGNDFFFRTFVLQ